MNKEANSVSETSEENEFLGLSVLPKHKRKKEKIKSESQVRLQNFEIDQDIG